MLFGLGHTIGSPSCVFQFYSTYLQFSFESRTTRRRLLLIRAHALEEGAQQRVRAARDAVGPVRNQLELVVHDDRAHRLVDGAQVGGARR